MTPLEQALLLGAELVRQRLSQTDSAYPLPAQRRAQYATAEGLLRELAMAARSWVDIPAGPVQVVHGPDGQARPPTDSINLGGPELARIATALEKIADHLRPRFPSGPG